MPDPLLPTKLAGPVIAALAGRSNAAVFKAKADGDLASFSTADVETWLGRAIGRDDYLRADRSVDALRAYSRARKRSL